MSKNMIEAGKQTFEKYSNIEGALVPQILPEEAVALTVYLMSEEADAGYCQLFGQIKMIEVVGAEYANMISQHETRCAGPLAYNHKEFNKLFSPWGSKTAGVLNKLADEYGVDRSVSEYIGSCDNEATYDVIGMGDEEFAQLHIPEGEKAAEFLKLLIANGEIPKAKYSIYGDTYPVKDQLKELGAKFNGDCWEIEMDKLEEAKAIVSGKQCDTEDQCEPIADEFIVDVLVESLIFEELTAHYVSRRDSDFKKELEGEAAELFEFLQCAVPCIENSPFLVGSNDAEFEGVVKDALFNFGLGLGCTFNDDAYAVMAQAYTKAFYEEEKHHPEAA